MALWFIKDFGKMVPRTDMVSIFIRMIQVYTMKVIGLMI